MFTLFTGRLVGGLKPPCWRTKEVLQHGGSILGSVILYGTFRRISQLWEFAHTLNLENCLLYLLSTISQFLDFVRCMIFDFIFYCVTAHTLYRLPQHIFKNTVTQYIMKSMDTAISIKTSDYKLSKMFKEI